jgi:hypothetical protein
VVEAVPFLLVAVVLYWLADRILDRIEVSRGARFEQRTIVFFFILLGMALVVFPVLRWLLGHWTPALD